MLVMMMKTWVAMMMTILSSVQSSTTLVLEGSSTSYAQFRKWYMTDNTTLQFEFRTQRPRGLLLYMDDGGYYDFLEVKLVEGAVRLRFNLGGGAQVISLGRETFDNSWHKVSISQIGPRTSLSVDSLSSSLVTRGDDTHLGNFTTNSYVYLGGLPPWYASKLTSLALPTVVFEPRYLGEIRNVVYPDSSDGQNKLQGMMAYKGVRQSKVDFCYHRNPCLNDGLCISTDVGPQCQCRDIPYQGDYCEEEKSPVEATFLGNEYLSFDLQQIGGSGAPILSLRDKITLSFKTANPNGMLFYSGSGEDFLLLFLRDGEIHLEIRLGSGLLKTGVSKNRFSDNSWHHITITRLAEKLSTDKAVCQVHLEVDGQYRERWTSPGSFSMLESSRVLVGGGPRRHQTRNLNVTLPQNFVGCLKQVEFVADNIHLEILSMAASSHPLISSSSPLDFICRSVAGRGTVTLEEGGIMANYYESSGQGGAISITRPAAFLILPNWQGQESGSLSVKFRTSEPNGVLFYNQGEMGDFFGMELIDGHLFVHLAMGTSPVKIRASNEKLDDSMWHRVDLERTGRTGRISIDSSNNDFDIPGDSSSLHLVGPLYVGGVPYTLHSHPWAVWSATLRQGYVGCLRDFVLNGRTIQLADVALSQDSGSILQTCQSSAPSCPTRPCKHGGQCMEGWNRYICDCSHTSFTGPICGRDAATLKFDGSQNLVIPMSDQRDTEVDNIVLRFRCEESSPSGLLLATRDQESGNSVQGDHSAQVDHFNADKDHSSTDRLEVALNRGKVSVTIRMDGHETVLDTGAGLNDGHWHTVKLSRRGRLIVVSVDGENPRTESVLSTTTLLRRTSYHIGSISHQSSPSDYPNLTGSLQQVTVNGLPLLEMEKNHQLKNSKKTTEFMPISPLINDAVTFRSHHTYLGLPQLKAFHDIQIHFQFRSMEPNGLVMFNAGKKSNFLAIELVDGHVKLVVNLGWGALILLDNYPQPLNNNQWHSVSVARPERDQLSLQVDHYISTAKTQQIDLTLELDGILFLGGVRSAMYGKLPTPISSNFGYQGCLGNLELGGESLDPMSAALVPNSHVVGGCDGLNLGCDSNSCQNQGTCRQFINTARECDCDLTSFTGPTCSDESTAMEWGVKTGLVKFQFPSMERPDTKADIVSLGIITAKSDAVIVRVDSTESEDYMELEIVEGNIFAVYNLGSQDIALGEMGVKVNDGKYHVVRFTRSGQNSTLQLDDYQVQTVSPLGHQLSVFNSQSTIQIGGKWNSLLSRVERPFAGVLAGLVYNNMRPLDLAKDRRPGSSIQGHVTVLDQIPFDWRDMHPILFEQMQRTDPSLTPEPGVNDDLIVMEGRGCDSRQVSPDCFRYGGSGDDLITPVYNTPPAQPPWGGHTTEKWPAMCGDDEDCDGGSGDGSWQEQFVKPISESTVKSYTIRPTYRTYFPVENPDTGRQPWEEDLDPPTIKTTNRVFPTSPSIPKPPVSKSGTAQESYEHYDTKYNIYDEEREKKKKVVSTVEPEDSQVKHTKSIASGTLLVIGIISGAIIAIILIIVIVLKMRTQVVSNYKVDESFAREDATSAALINSENGFYNKPVTKRNTNNNKPIKEWYV